MRVTLTGATGLIGTRLVRALRERGDEVTVLSRNPDRARRRSAASRRTPGTRRRAGAGRGARRPRRGRAPRRRERRPALERRRQAPHPRARASSARATSSRASRPPSRGPPCSCRASAVGYYGPHGDERADEDTPAGDDFLAEVCVVWEREAARGRGARPARRARPHRRRARPGRRRAGEDAAVLQARASAARSPAASQYMPWIHVDDVVGIYLAALDDATLERPGQRHRARAGHQQGVLEGARPRAAPPGVRARARRSPCARSTARWPRS